MIAAGMMAGCKNSGNESENSQISVPDNSSFVSEPISSDESSSVSEESSTVSQVSGTAAHTHSYTEKVIAPTCTADGYTLHECSCGKSYKDKTVSKKVTASGSGRLQSRRPFRPREKKQGNARFAALPRPKKSQSLLIRLQAKKARFYGL